MDRSQIIKIIKSHSSVVHESKIENLADHLLAEITVYYEKLETENRVRGISLGALGIKHD